MLARHATLRLATPHHAVALDVLAITPHVCVPCMQRFFTPREMPTPPAHIRAGHVRAATIALSQTRRGKCLILDLQGEESGKMGASVPLASKPRTTAMVPVVLDDCASRRGEGRCYEGRARRIDCSIRVCGPERGRGIALHCAATGHTPVLGGNGCVRTRLCRHAMPLSLHSGPGKVVAMKR